MSARPPQTRPSPSTGEKITIDELTAAFEGKTRERISRPRAAASDEHLTKVSYHRAQCVRSGGQECKAARLSSRYSRAPTASTTPPRAVEHAGGAAEIVVSPQPAPPTRSARAQSSSRAPSAARRWSSCPGGFSGGDEPDGSGKFIASFFRNPQASRTPSTSCSDSATA